MNPEETQSIPPEETIPEETETPADPSVQQETSDKVTHEKLDLLLEEMTKEGNSNEVLTNILKELQKEPTPLPVAEDQVAFNTSILETLDGMKTSMETTQQQVKNLEVIQSDTFDFGLQVAFIVIGLIVGLKSIEVFWRSSTKW